MSFYYEKSAYNDLYITHTKNYISEILRFLDLLDKYIDHHYKDYDIYNEEFIRKITFKKTR